MKLSESTFTILQNFASINESILIKSGSKISTIAVNNCIIAEADVDEDFPKDFAIYELTRFLNGLRLMKNPDLDFSEDSYVTIREGNLRVKYFFADPEVIVTPPDKKIVLPSDDVSFQIEHSQLDKLIKASSVYQLPDLSIVGDAGVIRLLVRNKRISSSNEYSIVVGETNNNFVFNFKVDAIKIIPGSYDVSLSKELLGRFSNKKYNITYHIPMEPDGTFS